MYKVVQTLWKQDLMRLFLPPPTMGIAGGHPCDVFGAFAQIPTTPDLANWLAIMCDLLLYGNNRSYFSCPGSCWGCLARTLKGWWGGKMQSEKPIRSPDQQNEWTFNCKRSRTKPWPAKWDGENLASSGLSESVFAVQVLSFVVVIEILQFQIWFCVL